MSSDPDFDFLIIGIILLIGLAVYMVPAIVAFWRDHPNRWLILIINAMLGGTGIVWLFCLVWAFRAAHIAASADGSDGGESGLNLAANDPKVITWDKKGSRPRIPDTTSSTLEKLERLRELHQQGTIDSDQFSRLRDHVLKESGL